MAAWPVAAPSEACQYWSPAGQVNLAPLMVLLPNGRRVRHGESRGQREISLQNYLWIMMGSALGGGARLWLSGFVAHYLGQTFPWGTILVNVTGSFVIGFFAALTEPDGSLLVSPTARQFVMIGLCGGYTTFSSFSLQTLYLARESDWSRAGANIFLSVFLCLLAVWLGNICAAGINQMRAT
jgi:CrcB protein